MKLVYRLNMVHGCYAYCWVDKTNEKFELSPYFITEAEANTWKDKIVEIMKDQLNVFDFDDWK